MGPLTDRQMDILVRVVEQFNETAEPVGSKTIADQEGITVSSATVRNTMAVMEELGLLHQPHTSAGRMPTWEGMRNYVDHLVDRGALNAPSDLDWGQYAKQVERESASTVAQSVSSVISQLSQLTSIVSSPELVDVELQAVHLSSLSGGRILVLLVTRDGRVFDRVVRLGESLDKSTLKRMQNYLSELVVGRSIQQVRREVKRRLEAAERDFRRFMRRALEIGQEVVEVASSSKLFVEGALNMLDVTELAGDVERARRVLRRLDDHERVLNILNRIYDAPKARALIGPELGDAWGDDLSLVVCGYYHDGRQVGWVGIMGPMRMNYARMIPLVENVAHMLSKELETLT